jgi:hypothetical protein
VHVEHGARRDAVNAFGLSLFEGTGSPLTINIAISVNEALVMAANSLLPISPGSDVDTIRQKRRKDHRDPRTASGRRTRTQVVCSLLPIERVFCLEIRRCSIILLRTGLKIGTKRLRPSSLGSTGFLRRGLRARPELALINFDRFSVG